MTLNKLIKQAESSGLCYLCTIFQAVVIPKCFPTRLLTFLTLPSLYRGTLYSPKGSSLSSQVNSLFPSPVNSSFTARIPPRWSSWEPQKQEVLDLPVPRGSTSMQPDLPPLLAKASTPGEMAWQGFFSWKTSESGHLEKEPTTPHGRGREREGGHSILNTAG